MPAAATIDEVIGALTGIIEQARAERSRLGYFPALYRKVTRAVQRGIAEGRFSNGPRMERLDVVFANRYLHAYETWRAGRVASQSWMIAFGAAGRSDLAIIQHLLLGMNAHINLDLPAAAAEVSPGNSIATLQGDFQTINDILSEQIGGVQSSIASVAPLMWMLQTVGGADEEWLVSFNLKKARDAAWMQANLLAQQPEPGRLLSMTMLDSTVAGIAVGVQNPPGHIVRTTLQFAVRSEVQDAVRVIDALQ